MKILSDSHIDFMKYRKVFVWVSAALLAVAIVAVFILGDLNLGIDFAGGTQLTVKFRQEPEVDRLRELISRAGVEDVVIQRFGAPGDNEVIIKSASTADSEEGSRETIVAALDEEFTGLNVAGGFDLVLGIPCTADGPLHVRLSGADPDFADQHVAQLDSGAADCRQAVGSSRRKRGELDAARDPAVEGIARTPT